ncbi:MAG: 3TM-type holin [Pseudomonadota bacterium]
MIWGDVAEGVVSGVGGVLDELFTSDEERDKAKLALERVRQLPAIHQMEVNAVEAKHDSTFVAGWRPATGWVCVLGLALASFHPIIVWAHQAAVIAGWTNIGTPMPAPDTGALVTILMGMLGLGGLRTYEKLKGVARQRIQ